MISVITASKYSNTKILHKIKKKTKILTKLKYVSIHKNIIVCWFFQFYPFAVVLKIETIDVYDKYDALKKKLIAICLDLVLVTISNVQGENNTFRYIPDDTVNESRSVYGSIERIKPSKGRLQSFYLFRK